jgi:hypothetical protein
MDNYQTPSYLCIKHGNVGTVTMTLTINNEKFVYCLHCVNEMLAKHCHQVTREDEQ